MALISKRYQYISLKNDYAFRELFSHESIRKKFLSDVLEIPLEEIRTVRVTSPYLWKRFRRQKLGILDMNMEMQDGTKVNIEMQVRQQEHWVRRQIFYLSKMYTEDLREGQDYGRLRKCISIAILDFNLTEDEKYHSVYRLRDKRGKELSNLLEIHILELNKKLRGEGVMNDWIRLFNARSEEDLEMIRTKNTGILEAMKILKNMNLRKTFRYLHEEHLKAIRDRKAEDDFVRNQGRVEGKAEGMAEGMAEGRIEGITEGMAEAILDLLKDVGTVPVRLQEQIYLQKNMEILRDWHRLAARVKTIEEFESHSGFPSAPSSDF